MKMLRVLMAKLRGLFAEKSANAEFEVEMEAHLAMLTERFVQQGMAPDEARLAARRQFGNTTLLQQRHREGRGFISPGTLWRDVKFGARLLARDPVFTLVAVMSLTLGIGANTAIFTAAKRVLLDTLPVRNPHELRMLNWTGGREQPSQAVWGDVERVNGNLVSNTFSYRAFEELRKRTDVFADLFAFKDVQVTASVDGHSQVVGGELVSGNTFAALGLNPIAGRPLSMADDSGSGKNPVAVISDGYWAMRFGRSPAAIGKSIELNGVPVTIVGVTPTGFSGLQMGSAADVFVPITLQPLILPQAQRTKSGEDSLLGNPEEWWIQIMERVRPDVSLARSQAALDVVLRNTEMAELPHAKGVDDLHLKLVAGDRGLDSLQGEYSKPSYMLMTLAGLVLLLACVNLANLLLARGAGRQREMSTRLALGAGRAQILRQVLTESLLLSGLGGAAGMGLGYLARNVIPMQLGAPWHGAVIDASFDWKVFAFTAAVSIATGILFGVFPAWQAMRINVNAALKDSANTTASRNKLWLGKSLVVTQIALSTILLIGAGLFVRTLVNLNNTPLGFREDHILMFKLDPPRTRYSDAQIFALYGQLEGRIAAIPGVRSVSMSNIAIIGDGGSGSTFRRAGTPAKEHEERSVQLNDVGPDYFATLGIPILQGRSLSVHDTASAPLVAVINQTLARKYYPNENPIGQSFEADAEDAAGPIEIVGVVADTKYNHVQDATPPTFYLNYLQEPEIGHMLVEVRTAADPGSVLGAVRGVVEQLDRDLPLIDVRTMTEQVASSLASERLFAQLTSAFGVLALVLASIGIYGIMAYTVSRRRREIGLRMALGAQREIVVWMVLREALGMLGIGLAVGIGCALMLSRLVAAQMYGVQATDGWTFAAAIILLGAVTLLSGFVPARRASSIDPLSTLRYQ